MRLWDCNDLNSEQEAAIFHDGNVLLVACPGSGKTRTLIYKIAYELYKLDSKSRFIVAITYTNAAAEEIKERVENMGIDISQLWIGTIHSFCLDWILRPYHHLLSDFRFGFNIADPQDTEDLLETLCKPFSIQKIKAASCAHYFTSKELYINDNTSKRATIVEILNAYHQYLIKERLMDFEMILKYSYEIISHYPVVTATLSRIFSYFLVDEYQDTKEIQYSILLQIVAKGDRHTKAFIVGDPNQSIYQSMGGYPMSISEIQNLSKTKFEEMFLAGNYRSSKTIISYFDYYKTHSNIIEPRGVNIDYKSTISYNFAVSLNDLVNEIIRLIHLNINERNISPKDICVIGPRWIPLASLTRALMAGMPNVSFNGPGMAPFAKNHDNFFYKLCRIALTDPAPNTYIRRIRWAKEIITELIRMGFESRRLTPQNLLKGVNNIHINEQEGIIYLRGFFDAFLNYFNIIKSASLQLSADYDSFFRASDKRIQSLVHEGESYITSTENFKRVFYPRSGITVSTIHGVKGAEFDTVIAFALLEGYVPFFWGDDLQNSAKRTLYVACSRAKRNLHLISERERKRPAWQGGFFEPTKVLSQYSFIYDGI